MGKHALSFEPLIVLTVGQMHDHKKNTLTINKVCAHIQSIVVIEPFIFEIGRLTVERIEQNNVKWCNWNDSNEIFSTIAQRPEDATRKTAFVSLESSEEKLLRTGFIIS